MSSATQDQWCEITAALRGQLARQVELIPAMTPDEIKGLAEAIDQAMWNELKAKTWDAGVRERRRTLEREAAYGG